MIYFNRIRRAEVLMWRSLSLHTCFHQILHNPLPPLLLVQRPCYHFIQLVEIKDLVGQCPCFLAAGSSISPANHFLGLSSNSVVGLGEYLHYKEFFIASDGWFFSFLIAINVYYYTAFRLLFSSSELEKFLLCSLRFRDRRSHWGGPILHRGPFLRRLRYRGA